MTMFFVGVARLERATACTPCKNASQLHHTPIIYRQFRVLGSEFLVHIKQKTPSEIAEGSVMGWRRPTFPQIDAVSSALRGLTSLFGMGRGGPPRYSHHVFLYMS